MLKNKLFIQVDLSIWLRSCVGDQDPVKGKTKAGHTIINNIAKTKEVYQRHRNPTNISRNRLLAKTEFFQLAEFDGHRYIKNMFKNCLQY